MGKTEVTDDHLSMLDRNTRNEVKRLQKLMKSARSKGNSSEESKLCNALGETFASSGLQQLALQYHTQDLEISQRYGQPLDIAVAHRKVGEMFCELGEFQEAVSHQEQYLSISEDLGDLIEQQRAHATLGRTFYTQLVSETAEEEGANPPDEEIMQDIRNKAGRHYISALKLTRTLRSKKLSSEVEILEMTARLHLNIGLLYEKWNTELSINYLKKALSEAQLNRDSTIQHLALVQLAEASLAAQDTSQAILFAEQAVKASQANDPNLAKSNEILSLAHIHTKNVVEARKCSKLALQKDMDLDTAMTVYKLTKLIMSTRQVDFGDSVREVGILSKISELFMKLALYSQALHWLEKELEMAKQCNSTSEVLADVHRKLGSSYKAIGDFQLSVYHYTQQLNLVSSADTWNNIALVYLADKQPFQACYDSVQAGLGEAQSFKDKMACLRSLIKIAKHHGEQEIIRSASEELARLENCEEESESSLTPLMSDVEISESEGEEEREEEESGSISKGKRGKIGRVNEKGETPLHQASIEGKTEKVRELLSKHATPNTRDHAGWTPLHEACNHGFQEIVELLVSAGAEINDRGGRECGGITPLHDAAQWGNLNIVKYLVQHGANTLAKDDEGRTALQLVTDILEEEQDDDVNSENRIQIKEFLENIKMNPPPLLEPPRPQQQAKLDTEEVFTSGASEPSHSAMSLDNYSKETCQKQSLTSVWRRFSNQNKENRNISVVDRLSKPPKQRVSNPLPGSSSKLGKHRSSEPNRPKNPDNELWKSSTSPIKRKHPDTNMAMASEEKRPKQSALLKKTSVVAPTVKAPTVQAPILPVLPVPQSTATHHAIPQPIVSAPKLRVKVKIGKSLFLMPVKLGQTISDLAIEAAQRYRAKLGILPKLYLKTADGAELTGEDSATELLADGDELVGEMEEVDHVGLLYKYQETCSRLGVEDVLKEVIDASGTSITLGKSMASTEQLECLFTTILSCVTLTELDISFNRLSKEVFTTLHSVLPTLTSLTSLNISGCGVNNTNFLKISESLCYLPLKSLHLDYSGLHHCLSPLIDLVVSLPELENLSAKCCTLNYTQLTTEQSHKFRDSRLSCLDISQNHLNQYPDFPKQLKRLAIGGLSIEDSGISLPASLEELSVENCGLNDTNFRSILINLPNITSFKCPHNHITGDSVLDLINLFPNLSVLDLSSNPLGPSGIATLTLAPPPTLILQNCRGAGITAETFSALHTVVKYCDLSFNKIQYQNFCNVLSKTVRDGVVCDGNKLIINGQGR